MVPDPAALCGKLQMKHAASHPAGLLMGACIGARSHEALSELGY
jgi:hypothetical protein